MLRAAWSSAAPRVKRQFLTEIVAELYRDGRKTITTTMHQSRVQARDQERDEVLAKFLATNVAGSRADRVQSAALLDRFNKWCGTNSLPPWSSVLLAKQMKARGFVTEKSHFVWWIGIALSQPPPPAPPSVRRKGRPKPSQKT